MTTDVGSSPPKELEHAGKGVLAHFFTAQHSHFPLLELLDVEGKVMPLSR